MSFYVGLALHEDLQQDQGQELGAYLKLTALEGPEMREHERTYPRPLIYGLGRDKHERVMCI